MDRTLQLKQFLEKSPNDCFLVHALALEYIKLGEEDNAQECFLQNIKNDPNYVATYYHLGKLLERKAEREQALNIYSAGMKMAKTNGDEHAFAELKSVYEELS